MEISQQSFRKAAYTALAISVLGLAAVSIPLIGIQHAIKSATSWYIQFIVGYAAMIIVVELVGLPLRAYLENYFVGVAFSVSMFFSGVCAGSATSMLIYGRFDVGSYILKPLFWMGLYGFIPAVLIGLIGSGLIRRMKKCEPSGSPKPLPPTAPEAG